MTMEESEEEYDVYTIALHLESENTLDTDFLSSNVTSAVQLSPYNEKEKRSKEKMTSK
jgi:hypothetical protein